MEFASFGDFEIEGGEGGIIGEIDDAVPAIVYIKDALDGYGIIGQAAEIDAITAQPDSFLGPAVHHDQFTGGDGGMHGLPAGPDQDQGGQVPRVPADSFFRPDFLEGIVIQGLIQEDSSIGPRGDLSLDKGDPQIFRVREVVLLDD